MSTARKHLRRPRLAALAWLWPFPWIWLLGWAAAVALVVGSRLLALTGEAAHADGRRLRVLSSQLPMADQVLLTRMGYRLTQAGDYFEMDLSPKGAG